MPDETEIRRKFWKALRSDMTVMLGLGGAEPVAPRPIRQALACKAEH